MGSPKYANKMHESTHGPAIEDEDTAAGATPTDAEYDSLVGKFNALLAACRSANIIS